uniref:Protein kinase domain-containing protein n=1 Tax=Trichobilharzia regenti TaxID=157069 RepID=A0AA85JGF3_TRIRE|nr:unnamed protein product [Trichobilharzia regenti]
MEVDNQKTEHENEVSQELSSAGEVHLGQDSTDRKDDDEEEEEEEEEDKIVEKSHNSRFHKRNKRFPKQIEGVDNAFVAIEPKSGKEVIWNECILPEKKTDKENRYLSLIKKLKKNSHPFLVRFLDAWVSKTEEGPRKLVFITERLDECTLKQFLCNSARNNRLWNRHVGQLLSVLMFLHRLGVAHGNLTKESIYYQNSGNLRVGLFALSRCLDQKSEAFDVYSLGVVSLEIAVWTPLEFPQNLDLPERCQQMMSRLDNNNQKSFIEACFDTSSATKGLIKRLLNHPAVTEVPILKLLSARMIVNSMISVTNEEGGQNEPTGFASLLKDYLSRYEDETVIMEVHFPHDKLVKTRLWKDFRSNFTLTSKYLEDVKNGFYPLFGCRWDAYQGEDEEVTCVAYTGAPVLPPTNGLTSNLSTASGIAKNDPHVSVGYCSSCTSTTPSTSVSRKHSLAVKLTDLTSGSQFATEDQAPTQCEETSKGNVDTSHVGLVDCLSNQVSKTDSSRLFKVADTDRKRDDASVKASEVPGLISVPTFDDDNHSPSKTAPPLKTSQTIEIGQAELKWSEKPFDPPLDITEKSEIRGQYTLETREDDTCSAPPDEATQPIRKSPLDVKSDLSIDIQQKEITNSDAIGLTDEKALDANTISDDEDDDNGDDDDDEDEKRVVEQVERYEPQTVHVNPPERAPNHPALFTHCQYLYVGAGRWQVYVQMWFVEDRLKRETYVQVFDYEWHDHERVADLFEASKCLSPVDRCNLVRLLALARHNCALIDGELQFPGPIATRQSNFDTLELHEKLAALHLHQQVKEHLVSSDSGASKHAVHSSSVTPKVDSSQASSTKHEQNGVEVVRQNPAAVVNEVTACAEHINQVQLHHCADQTQDTPTPREASVGVSDTDGTKENQDPGKNKTKATDSENALFLDVGSLAPRNSYCALCDTHDYLHQIELPAYLISPCYHCREYLAREAKITPEILLDLHLQHNIPWPGFLQARLGIPSDGRSTEELIAYDCRWRSRQPCRCYAALDGSLLPPCVEFPWLTPTVCGSAYEVNETVITPKKVNKPYTSNSPPSSEVSPSVNMESRVPDSSPVTQAQSTTTNQTMTTSTATSVNASISSTTGCPNNTPSKLLLPCSNRHARGAPITCCHGIHFPLVGIPNTSNQGVNQNQDTSIPSSTDLNDSKQWTDTCPAVTLHETQQGLSTINDSSS